jgi:beta-lactamase superfamily II metal-dependent hydrolase
VSTSRTEAKLRFEMLPARHGDCLLLHWDTGTRQGRVLIDVGPATAYEGVAARLRQLKDPRIDLLVLTHVDADHIEGAILLLNDSSLGLSIDQVWYNGSPHLTNELGPVQGEIVGSLIAERAIPWNASFDGAAVRAPESGDLQRRELPGGLRLTVLAPDSISLRRLRDAWWESCQEAGIAVGSVSDALAALRAKPALLPVHSYLSGAEVMDIRELARSRSGSDTSITNASSIVLLVEYGDARILLAGDATPAALTSAVRRLLAERGSTLLPLTVFKLPHHGSAKNVTAELVRQLPADYYLFSTDGSYFRHPDETAVATVIQYGPPAAELVFNYDTPRTRVWDDADLRARYGYHARYPNAGAAQVDLALRLSP